MEATKIPPPQQMEDKEEKESPEDEEGPKNGGGWGGWVFSTFSVLSDLQKAAAVAAEEIALNTLSRNFSWLEHSAVNFADSMNHGGLPAGSVAPSLIKELEALSSHYALLFNRRKTTLPTEQKSMYEGKLKEIQLIFTSDSGMDGNDLESAKGKTKDSHDEMKILHDSSIRKYADMAVFINALAGLAVNDIIQRTTRRLESLHPEGVHVSKSGFGNVLFSGVSPPDAWHILCNQSLRSSRESATVDSHEALPQASIQEKAKSFSEHLHDDRATAVSKI
ncbi:hypothetical protein GOBAR_DD19885 [Gossypium barbadense]|nr:hypothetical protein GOBAR_DD19885 [Gossypium barbadense]